VAEVLIYTKGYCPYCDKAKHLLTKKGVTFKEVNVENDEKTFTELKEKTGLRTVPQIFINGHLIGGFTDMAALDQKGELDPLLK
jgi:glutaredoxin 3